MRVRNNSYTKSEQSIAVELGLIATVLVGVSLWQRALRTVADPLVGAVGGFPVGGLVTGGLFVAGLASFARAYTASRGIDVGVVLPGRGDLTVLGLATVAPAAFVAGTKLVGVLTDVTYQSLTMTHYGSTDPLQAVLSTIGLELLVAVPGLVVVCQVFVQGSFRRVLGGESAIVATILVTGFLTRSDVGGFTVAPEPGKLVGAALFVPALAVALYAAGSVDRAELRYLSYAPVLLFAGLIVLSEVTGIESIAGGLFTVSHLAVLGIAAYTYERTSSLLVPALAYLSLLLANDVVVVVLETGL